MCTACSSMVPEPFYSPAKFKTGLGKYNYSNIVSIVDLHNYKPKMFTNNLVSTRYSNMTDSEAQSACQKEYDADPIGFGPKYNNDFNKCVSSKKSQETQETILAKISGAGNFFTQLGNALNVFLGTGQPGGDPNPTGTLPPADKKSLGAGAWIAIIAGIALTATVVIVVVNKSKNSGGK